MNRLADEIARDFMEDLWSSKVNEWTSKWVRMPGKPSVRVKSYEW